MSHTASACIACSQVDDHPKHQQILGDHSSVRHHHDCGALLDPPCGVCAVIADEAPRKGNDIVKGDELRSHLVSLPQRWWTHHPDGSVTYTETDPAEGA